MFAVFILIVLLNMYLSFLLINIFQVDAEIVFWESKSREQQQQIEFLAQEAARLEKASRTSEDQVAVFTQHHFVPLFRLTMVIILNIQFNGFPTPHYLTSILIEMIA